MALSCWYVVCSVDQSVWKFDEVWSAFLVRAARESAASEWACTGKLYDL